MTEFTKTPNRCGRCKVDYLDHHVCMTLSPDLARSLRTAGRKVEEWTTERDRLIREAVKAGGSLREVGAAVGMSHMAVKFITQGRPK